MLFRSISCPDIIQSTQTTFTTVITYLLTIPYLADGYVRCTSPSAEDVEDEERGGLPSRAMHRSASLLPVPRLKWVVDNTVDGQQELPEYRRTFLLEVARVSSAIYNERQARVIATQHGFPFPDVSPTHRRSELDWEDREELEVLRTLGVPVPVHREGAKANVLAGCQRKRPGNILRIEDLQ